MRRLAVLLVFCLAACSMFNDSTASQKFVAFFQEWSAALDDPALATISTAAQWAKGHPTDLVTVTGYADPTGSQQSNVDLSRTRAQVVADQLRRDGVDPSRIKLTAHGPTDFTDASLESRRVEIAIRGT